jgi:DNA invertase Pin-like site-specific DNA recombinase
VSKVRTIRGISGAIKKHRPVLANSGKLIAYARVSKSDQNLSLQLAAFDNFGVDRVFTEKKSGRRVAREQLTAALEFLRSGDTFVVWKLDRLGRSTSQLASMLVELHKRDIDFVSLTQHIDTRTPLGKMIYHITAAFAEMEADLVTERTTAGVAEARARGAVIGRRPVSPSKIRAIRKLMTDPDLTAQAIADQLGLHRSTVYKYAHATDADIGVSMAVHQRHRRYQVLRGNEKFGGKS